MNSVNEKVKARLEKLRKGYRELKRGGGMDPFLLKKEIGSFISDLKSKGEDYEEVRKDAEDMLMDVTFVIQENRCSPFKAKSIK